MVTGWGIVGTGEIADRGAAALKKVVNTRLVSVCDSIVERAQSFAKKHGVERVFDSLDKMLEIPGLDVLYISTPNRTHAQLAIQAAEAGKHVLCEKPMATTVDDAEAMVRASEKNNIKLGVMYARRYHPVYVEVHRLIQAGTIGKIRVATMQNCRTSWKEWPNNWRRDLSVAGAGALVAQGVHGVDLFRFLMDTEVTEVQAVMEPSPLFPGIEDMVYVILTFANGAYGTLISGIRIPFPDNGAVFYGSEARITSRDTTSFGSQGLGEIILNRGSTTTTTTFPAVEPTLVTYMGTMEAFNNWVMHGIEPLVTGQNGLEMVRVTSAIIESGHKGNKVKIVR